MTVYWPCPPERQDARTLPDGRTFAWSEWGQPGGRPVLYCAGAGMSGTLAFAPPGPDVRLIAPDRPGLGRSSPHPQKTLLTWAADVNAALDLPGSAAAIGFSQGAAFALALADAGVVEAVALVSGQDELSHPAIHAQLPSEVASFVDALGSDPAFSQWFATEATASGLLERIIDGSSERDLEVYTDPRFSPHLRRAIDEGFRQGPAGYARDLVNTMQPWPFRVEDIRQKVYLWYGALDMSPVHSPDFGATLARRLPNAERILDPEEGGSLLWTRAAEIVGELLPA